MGALGTNGLALEHLMPSVIDSMNSFIITSNLVDKFAMFGIVLTL